MKLSDFMNKTIIFGAGGFGAEVAMAIHDINAKSATQQFDLIGFIDDDASLGDKSFAGIDVIGNTETLLQYKESVNVVIAVNKPSTRKKIAEKLVQNHNLNFPNIIHPTAIAYLDTCNLGKGNIIFLFSVVSYNVTLGDFNIMNSYSGFGHDAVIGNYNTFNPRVAISGGVKIGELNEFGMNSSIVQYKSVGNNNVVGANSLLLRNIRNDSMYFGTPALKIEI